MDLDDPVCVCHRVSLRKLVAFARRERPANAARMSECLGAGTGCGWCIPVLTRIALAAAEGGDFRLDVSSDEYLAGRARYRSDAGRIPDADAPPGYA
jgi:bacterioferritin-associated ferredoxin